MLTRRPSLRQASGPASGTELDASFLNLAADIPRRGLVVIISDLLSDRDEVFSALQRFRYSSQDVIVLHVMDHDELEFPFLDRTLFEGMELVDQQVMTDPQALRNSYLENVRSFINDVRGMCLDHHIDYALLSTADPLDVSLTTFLATRLHRQRAKA